MRERQTRNVSLSRQDDRLIDALVVAGRFRTASEVVREGLRMVEQADRRRLFEQWMTGQLTAEDDARLPEDFKHEVRERFRALLAEATAELERGRASDGATAVDRMRKRLEDRGA